MPTPEPDYDDRSVPEEDLTPFEEDDDSDEYYDYDDNLECGCCACCGCDCDYWNDLYDDDEDED